MTNALVKFLARCYFKLDLNGLSLGHISI